MAKLWRNVGTAALGAAALLLATAPAQAVDGVYEINQTCALATGCFAGDDPGFPVTIEFAGSFRLTSNLDIVAPVPDSPSGGDISDTSGIVLDLGIETLGGGGSFTPQVTIDLNGFAILGETTCFVTGCDACLTTGGCNGSAPTGGFCNNTGPGIGIYDGVFPLKNRGGSEEGFDPCQKEFAPAGGQTDWFPPVVDLRVVNGSIIGMGDSGIAACEAKVENVTLSQNGFAGLLISHGVVDSTRTTYNGVMGMFLFARGLVTHSYSASNQFGLYTYGDRVGLYDNNFDANTCSDLVGSEADEDNSTCSGYDCYD